MSFSILQIYIMSMHCFWNKKKIPGIQEGLGWALTLDVKSGCRWVSASSVSKYLSSAYFVPGIRTNTGDTNDLKIKQNDQKLKECLCPGTQRFGVQVQMFAIPVVESNHWSPEEKMLNNRYMGNFLKFKIPLTKKSTLIYNFFFLHVIFRRKKIKWKKTR